MTTNEIVALSDVLDRLETKFDLTQHKVHILRMMVDRWEKNTPVYVLDVVNGFDRLSRATTHRMLKELVSVKLVKETVGAHDRRTRLLTPGAKFESCLKELRK